MIFALYGRVPRLGARAVAPVITAGADRARVSLDFEVRGDRFVVSRVAERTDSGASVREARLERADGSSVASGAGEVTREVEDLLRLRFEDFTKTVVLPQGEFARFLNAGSKERRDLLRDLLGLHVYARVRELASERKSEASGRAGSARSQLGSLEVPAPEDLIAARDRLQALEELEGEIAGKLDDLERAESSLRAREGEVEELDDARSRLAEIAAPDHLGELEGRLAAAREAESVAEEALSGAQDELSAIDAAVEELPSEETISNIRIAREELAKVEARISGLNLVAARSEVDEAETALSDSESGLAEAQERVDASRVSHAAHTVRSAVVVGELCPVCAQRVESVPSIEEPPVVGELEDALASAREEVAVKREGLQTVRARFASIEARASELETQREGLAERVAGSLSLEELSAAEEDMAKLVVSAKTKRSEIEDLETTLRRARRGHEDAAEAVESVDRSLWLARDEVSDLKPPYPEGADPMVRWKELLVWRDTTSEELAVRRGSILDELESERAGLSKKKNELVSALEAVGVPTEEPYDVSVTRELEVARGRVDKLEEITERARTLEAQLKEAERTEAIAGALANHLRANGFERWLMAGAITGLVTGANQLLSQLSGGGYSLEADAEGSFRIIDHRNADEVRDVATLSGGETFLVSLALSLSLAETLSASGGAGLDAIILDEGFGTLDEESLDVVASVLEELAGRGLMVGVITHVKELAARAPVRYRVTREPEGSKVEMLS
jgi:exonuclease SbcC